MKSSYKNYVKNVAVPVLIYGAFTGIVVGTAVYFFKLIAEKLAEWSVELYNVARSNFLVAVALVVGAVLLAVVMTLLQKWSPETKGGGIPRAEGILRGLLPLRWIRTSIVVVVNSFISFFVGLPLGSEGPSVLLGTSLAGGTCKLPLSHESWDRYIMTGGASAGFAVATGAPVTGILFAVEEAHKRFTPMISLMAISSVVFAVITSNVWSLALGTQVLPLFDVGSYMGSFTLGDIWLMPVIGIVIAVLSCLYNQIVFLVGKLYDTKLRKVPEYVRLILVFCVTVVVGLVVIGDFNGSDALYGGGGLITAVAKHSKTLKILFVLLILRFVMITFSTGSGATGGVFIPMLSIGALIGGVLGDLFIECGMDEGLYATVVIISMSCFMGACTRTPLTALVFVLESTWNFTNLFYVAIAVFVSYFICEIVKVEPLYDVLLDRMTKKQNEGKTHKIARFVYVVKEGSFAVDKSVRDILWPANCKVSEIVADDSVKSMDDDGERKIHVGDKVTVIVQTFDEHQTKKELNDILGVQAKE